MLTMSSIDMHQKLQKNEFIFLTGSNSFGWPLDPITDKYNFVAILKIAIRYDYIEKETFEFRGTSQLYLMKLLA